MLFDRNTENSHVIESTAGASSERKKPHRVFKTARRLGMTAMKQQGPRGGLGSSLLTFKFDRAPNVCKPLNPKYEQH